MLPATAAMITPTTVRWCWAALWVGSATAKPANRSTTSDGTGMQAHESAISRKMAGSPPSRTRCDVAFTTDSLIDASTSMRVATIACVGRCASGST